MAPGAWQSQRSRQDPAWGVPNELDLCRKAGHQQSSDVGGSHRTTAGAQRHGAIRSIQYSLPEPRAGDARDPEMGRIGVLSLRGSYSDQKAGPGLGVMPSVARVGLRQWDPYRTQQLILCFLLLVPHFPSDPGFSPLPSLYPPACPQKTPYPGEGSTQCLHRSPMSCWIRGWGMGWKASPFLLSGETLGFGVRGWMKFWHWYPISHSLGDVEYTQDFLHNCRELRHTSVDLYHLYTFFMSLCYYILKQFKFIAKLSGK